MSVHGELADLAVKISGAGWARKFPADWTREEATAFESATPEEAAAWLEWILGTPVTVETDQDGRITHVRYGAET